MRYQVAAREGSNYGYKVLSHIGEAKFKPNEGAVFVTDRPNNSLPIRGLVETKLGLMWKRVYVAVDNPSLGYLPMMKRVLE